jgi:acetyl-CoA carboxylase carboxyltransferase component
MSWKDEVEELRRREELAQGMGGPERVQRHHDAGRLTVRERMDQLLDPGTFHETGALTGLPEYENGRLVSIRPSNFVMGTGRIDGQRVVVGGDDFTVRGGGG